MSGTSIPTEYQNANPLLYTFRDYHTSIQPYFIIVSQFFIFEFSLRLWDRAVYGTWLLPSDMIIFKRSPLPSPPEPTTIPIYVTPPRRRSSRVRTIYLLKEYKSLSVKPDQMEEMPTFDLFDIFFSILPLLAHTIWYCSIQPSCMSGEYANIWNCYNLFGYRLYNYLFEPFLAFSYEYISKLIIMHEQRKLGIPFVERKKKWRQTLAKIIFYPSLVLSTITFIFVGALILPYLLTNVLPMVVIYSFMVTIYAYALTIVTLLIKFYTHITGKIFSFDHEKLGFFKTQMKKYHFRRRLVIRFGIRLFPLLISILFNLSQYFYYGEDFWEAIGREADSRDPSPYFVRVGNSAQIAHTILSTI